MKKTNKRHIIISLSFLFTCVILVTACKKKSDETPLTGPFTSVATGNYSNVLLNTVQFAGNVTDDHGYTVKKLGFCWSSTNQVPTIQDDTIECSESSKGSFNDTIKELKGQTLYYVRAYAININGTGYGSVGVVTTIDSSVTDADNNHYRIVQIGTQVWMAENLKTTKFNDGTSIPLVIDEPDWEGLSTPGYCWYGNNVASKNTYGALYNWYTVTSDNFSPVGWHVPTQADWTALNDFLGGDLIAGYKLKEAGIVHWANPNAGATNSTGFTGLPGGARSPGVGYDFQTNYGYFWSVTENTGTTAWGPYLYYNDGTDHLIFWDKVSGFSVRCIRN
jgi:uncharacterized protein (TIGR02145 family)